MPRYYLDTSAYLAVLLGEPGGTEIAGRLARSELLSSTLLPLEAQRTLVRAARAGDLSVAQYDAAMSRLDEDLASFELRDLTLDLAVNRVMAPVSTPRSLDLAHLRTAAWFHAQAPLTALLSCDTAMLDAARQLGLPT